VGEVTPFEKIKQISARIRGSNSKKKKGPPLSLEIDEPCRIPKPQRTISDTGDAKRYRREHKITTTMLEYSSKKK